MKILVVDDEKVIREMLKEVLESNGNKVKCAKTAREAISVIENESVDLIISDVHMPGVNGYELLLMVKEKKPAVPVIMMDSFPEELSEMCLKRGALKCIHKPFDLKELRQIINFAENLVKNDSEE